MQPIHTPGRCEMAALLLNTARKLKVLGLVMSAAPQAGQFLSYLNSKDNVLLSFIFWFDNVFQLDLLQFDNFWSCCGSCFVLLDIMMVIQVMPWSLQRGIILKFDVGHELCALSSFGSKPCDFAVRGSSTKAPNVCLPWCELVCKSRCCSRPIRTAIILAVVNGSEAQRASGAVLPVADLRATFGDHCSRGHRKDGTRHVNRMLCPCLVHRIRFR